MDNPYLHPLVLPAFEKFTEAEKACDVAWENVKEARTTAARKVALENFQEIQYQARLARSLTHKCEYAANYRAQEEE